MNIRKVHLHDGPCDGSVTLASHSMAIHGGEVYIWDGGEDPDRFAHALTASFKIPEMEAKEEIRLIKAAYAKVNPDKLPKLDPWRLLLWTSLLNHGEIE